MIYIDNMILFRKITVESVIKANVITENMSHNNIYVNQDSSMNNIESIEFHQPSFNNIFE